MQMQILNWLPSRISKWGDLCQWREENEREREREEKFATRPE